MIQRYNTLYTAAEVDAQIAQIAQEIISDYPEKQPLFVALLRGAAPFASKLLFAIARRNEDVHPELDYMMVSSYGSARHANVPRIVTGLAPATEVKNRSVIIIDDVLDKGITAHFVSQYLEGLGATDIKLAVLADKQTTRVQPIEADYVGFTVQDEWLVGMGMDDAYLCKEGHRWIEEIREIKRD